MKMSVVNIVLGPYLLLMSVENMERVVMQIKLVASGEQTR